MQFESNSTASSESSSTAPSSEWRSQSDRKSDHRFLEDAESFRSDTYRILARLFRAAPDRELLRGLAGSSSEVGGSKLGAAWRELSEASRQADPVLLDREFHALFIGLGRGEVLPYASWYLSGFLLDKPLARLRTDLKALGIERAENVTESEDHFAAICETMALLVETDGGIDYAGQKRFYDQHLQPWVSRFLDDVRAARNARFYRHVADLGQRFFEFEESWLTLPQ